MFAPAKETHVGTTAGGIVAVVEIVVISINMVSKLTHSCQLCHCFTKAFSSSISSGEYRGNATRRTTEGIYS